MERRWARIILAASCSVPPKKRHFATQRTSCGRSDAIFIFLTKRAEERLSFELQPQLAERLGYKDRRGMRGVERFMRHYFLVAKDVGDLTTVLCSALEVQQLKEGPGFRQIFNPTSWRVRRRVRSTD